MDYKQVAVYKERQLKQKTNRLTILLYNAIVLLEDSDYEHDTILTALGLTEKEHKEIMN